MSVEVKCYKVSGNTRSNRVVNKNQINILKISVRLDLLNLFRKLI